MSGGGRDDKVRAPMSMQPVTKTNEAARLPLAVDLDGTLIRTDIFFELGQHSWLRVHLIGSIPAWLEQVWLFNGTRTQFLNAVFDVLDIVAAMLGALAALVATLRMRPAGEPP